VNPWLFNVLTEQDQKKMFRIFVSDI
jgi:hypothetical protein